MAERTSSMGSKDRLAKLLTQEVIDGSYAEVANTHEVNRQSAVKEILVHVFLMSKFNIIGSVLTVGEAQSQYLRASGGQQAAHCAPGQILSTGVPIQNLLTASVDLQLAVENLFGRTDAIDTKFNKADSRAEENGLRNAFGRACGHAAGSGKTVRFNRAYEFYRYISAAFLMYKSAGIQAYMTAGMRQRALMKPNDPTDRAEREETIRILEAYSSTLSTSDDSLETVQGLFPEDLWRQYRTIV